MGFAITLGTDYETLLTVTPEDRVLRHEARITGQPKSYGGVNLRQLFDMEFVNGKAIIKSMYGTYISARKHRECVMTTDNNPKHWECFTFISGGVNRVAIQTAFDLYLTSGGKNGVVVQREKYELFTITFLPVSLRTTRGTLLSSSTDGSINQVSKKLPGADEIFHLDLHDGGFYMRTSSKKYISAREDGTITQVTYGRNCERFSFSKCFMQPYFYIKTIFDSVLSAPDDGTCVRQIGFVRQNEQFEVVPI